MFHIVRALPCATTVTVTTTGNMDTWSPVLGPLVLASGDTMVNRAVSIKLYDATLITMEIGFQLTAIGTLDLELEFLLKDVYYELSDVNMCTLQGVLYNGAGAAVDNHPQMFGTLGRIDRWITTGTDRGSVVKVFGINSLIQEAAVLLRTGGPTLTVPQRVREIVGPSDYTILRLSGVVADTSVFQP